MAVATSPIQGLHWHVDKYGHRRHRHDYRPFVGLSQRFIEKGEREGHITVLGKRYVVRPAGTPDDPWKDAVGRRTNHLFMQADQIILRLKTGDQLYTVRRNPDRYDAAGHATDSVASGDEVTYEFQLDLEEA